MASGADEVAVIGGGEIGVADTSSPRWQDFSSVCITRGCVKL